MQPPEQRTGYQPTDDERALSLVAHASIFLTCIGIVVAAVTWTYVQNRMPYAAFQAAQAVLFQLAVIVVFLLIIMTTLALFLGMFAVVLFGAPFAGDVSLALLVSLFNIVTGLPLAAFALFVYCYAIYAGYQSYRGYPLRIPGIAVLANAISPMPPVESEGIQR